MAKKHGPFDRRPGPTRAEQGRCRDYDSLRALFEAHGATPFKAGLRAARVLEGRARVRPVGRGR